MRGRHVARRFQGICRSRYGGASLAVGEEGAFQSWLGDICRGQAAKEKEECILRLSTEQRLREGERREVRLQRR